MKQMLQDNLQTRSHNPHITLTTGMAWGLMGGLVGTMVMDVLLMGALSVAGLPAFTCFSIVGDTAARFFSMLGIETAGGVLSGVATHYLVGPLVGALFGAVVAQVYTLRAFTPKKGIIFAVLFVEILAQPILASTPILLKMTAAETLLWFGGSFVMHFVFGIVLGAVLSYGLRLSVAVNDRSLEHNPG
jgi:hypothetical protein